MELYSRSCRNQTALSPPARRKSTPASRRGGLFCFTPSSGQALTSALRLLGCSVRLGRRSRRSALVRRRSCPLYRRALVGRRSCPLHGRAFVGRGSCRVFCRRTRCRSFTLHWSSRVFSRLGTRCRGGMLDRSRFAGPRRRLVYVGLGTRSFVAGWRRVVVRSRLVVRTRRLGIVGPGCGLRRRVRNIGIGPRRRLGLVYVSRRPCHLIRVMRLHRVIVRTRNRIAGGRMRHGSILVGPRSICIVRRASGRNVYRRVTRCNDSGFTESRGLGRGRYWRTPLVHACELVAFLTSHLLVLSLRTGSANMRSAQRCFLLRSWPCIRSTLAAVVAHAGCVVVVHHGGVIDIVDVGDVHVVHRAIVIEIVVAPIATLVAITAIPVSVIDATVVAHLGTPVASVPDVGAFAPTPPTRRPKITRLRSHNPSPRNPVITAVISICPIAGRPDITRGGA